MPPGGVPSLGYPPFCGSYKLVQIFDHQYADGWNKGFDGWNSADTLQRGHEFLLAYNGKEVARSPGSTIVSFPADGSDKTVFHPAGIEQPAGNTNDRLVLAPFDGDIALGPGDPSEWVPPQGFTEDCEDLHIRATARDGVFLSEHGGLGRIIQFSNLKTKRLNSSGWLFARGEPVGSLGTLGEVAPRYGDLGVRDLTAYLPSDVLGWDADDTGRFSVPLDPNSDPWVAKARAEGYRALPVSRRTYSPVGPPGAVVCPIQCQGAVEETVDNDDPGFSCTGCQANNTVGFHYGDNWTHIQPGGFASNGNGARWQSSLAPGKYAVLAFISSPRDTNEGPEPVLSARYSVAGSTVFVNQYQTVGWTLLGNFNFKNVAPYVDLSDVSRRGGEGEWFDFPECANIMVDAVKFVGLCNLADEGILVPSLTNVPRSTIERPTPCFFGAGCGSQ